MSYAHLQRWSTLRPHRLSRLSLRSYSTSPSSSNLILVAIDGPKATITLNNAKIGNALDVDLQKSLIGHFKDLSARKDVRAIVLTAVGTKFCTGMNLGSKGESLSGNNEEQHDRLKVLFESISNCSKPVIGVINGACYGGGNGLAMVCDFRVASTPAVTFTLSEVKLGVSPALISKYLVREWGASKTREAMLTGRPMTAQELLPLGGVHHICTDQPSALAKADEIIAQLVGSAPGAMAICKELVNTMATQEEDAQDGLIKETFLDMMRPSKEAEYGIKMYRQKTKPVWASLEE